MADSQAPAAVAYAAVPARPCPAGGRPKRGAPAAVALAVGTIVGTAAFLLPALPTAYGVAGILAFGLVTVGVIALALVFGGLGRRAPAGDGPYAGTREAFGEFPGFWSAWSFWLTAWVGNAGLASAWAVYVGRLLGWEGTGERLLIALVGLWAPALINLSGLRNAGAVRLFVTAFTAVPLVFAGVAGPFVASSANGPSHTAGVSWLGAFSLAGALVLVTRSGPEGRADRLRVPARNVGVYCVLACAAMYLLSTIAIAGSPPPAHPAAMTLPFADAIGAMAGSVWGAVFAAGATLAGLAALGGWMWVVAEIPLSAARNGVFPRVFAEESRRGTPWASLLAGTGLSSLVLLWSHLAGANAARTVLLVACFTAVVPYVFSACARLYWLVTADYAVGRARDAAIAVVALLFGFWMAYAVGRQAITLGFLMLLAGVPVYVWSKAERERPGPAPATPVASEPGRYYGVAG